MTMMNCPPFSADIYIGGDLAQAKQICRKYCYEKGLCVTVTPVDYIYTGAEEAGVKVSLINYARYPSTPNNIALTAFELASLLLEGLCQHSYSVVTPEESVFFSRRKD